MDEDFALSPTEEMNYILKVGEEKEIDKLGLKKKLIKEGQGWENPKDPDEVLVNYEATLEDGKLVARSDGVVFIVGEGHYCPALSKAIKTMAKGEKVVLTVNPQNGFGEKGKPAHGDEGAVPPNATFHITLELESWKTVSEMEVVDPRAQSPLSPIFPDEIVINILSRLPVKSLIQFLCVSQPWKSLISHDPHFVKLHLERSPKNTNIILMVHKNHDADDEFDDELDDDPDIRAIFCSKFSLSGNTISSIVAAEDHRSLLLDFYYCIGSCNGLVCFRKNPSELYIDVLFWNPALRLCSDKSPPFSLQDLPGYSYPDYIHYGFGYDSSSDTYKVVVMILCSQNMVVNVHTMGDNCWKEVLRFPTFPMLGKYDGEFISGTINWLALREFGSDHGSRSVVFSLDLEKLAFKDLSLPMVVAADTDAYPCLKVLGGYLCLYHYCEGTQFVMWQMKEFGDENSWTQLFNINLLDFDSDIDDQHEPLCTTDNGDVVVLAICEKFEEIICNWKYNMSASINHSETEEWVQAEDYIESLVLPLPSRN